jgi:hypothetical protein
MTQYELVPSDAPASRRWGRLLGPGGKKGACGRKNTGATVGCEAQLQHMAADLKTYPAMKDSGVPWLAAIRADILAQKRVFDLDERPKG